MEEDFFWFFAISQLLVSLRVVVLIRKVDKPVSEKVLKLASGQRQDSWFASAVIWGMIFAKTLSYSYALFIGACARVCKSVGGSEGGDLGQFRP